MKEFWWELRIAVPGDGVDLVCSELMEFDCTGITVEERRLDTFVLPDPDEPISGTARIRAFFSVAPDRLEPLRAAVRDRLAWLAAFIPGLEPDLPEALPVRTEDWAEGWKQHFSTVHIGDRLVIRPSWEEYPPRTGEVVVILDPGMAFGTGTHGTTRLCLEALAGLFAGPSPPRRVLDVGTGSGILAMAAAALGATRVLACDIEPEACRTARDNVGHNGLAAVVEVTEQPLESLEGGFDLVLANILAEENIRLAEALTSRLAPGGSLVLSGILREKEALVSQAFGRFFPARPQPSHRDDWSCLLFHRNA
jgi:ribosomal protein L11 methyltransferase